MFIFPYFQVMARIQGNSAFNTSKKEAEIAVEEMMAFLAKAKVNMKIFIMHAVITFIQL